MHESKPSARPELSRRRFLKTSAIAGAAAWLPAFRISAADAASCTPPPNFPAGIELFQQAFENWSKGIVIDDLWTCAPRSAQECVAVVNWAANNGWKVRPRGAMHNWSPIHVTADTDCNDKVLLLSTTEYLTATSLVTGYATPAVRAQCGVFMEDLLAFLEANNLGMTAVPAPGDVTIGGVLAIDAHGTAVPALGETRQPGHTYGSLSNLILQLTVIVWDKSSNAYVLKTYDRSDRECQALAAHLGRAFVVDAVLQVGVDSHLRCQSFTHITADEMLGPPGSNGRTVERYLDQSGRMEVIWFPFTEKPWLKVWTVSPKKPLFSREVTEPYNYPFSDNIPAEVEELGRSLTRDNKQATPVFGQMMYNVSVAGLAATNSADIWGKSRTVLLYIKPSTLRVTASGYAVVTRRNNVQRVIHDFAEQYKSLVASYEAQGEYPINMPVEIRVTGLDTSADVDAAPAHDVALSAIAPHKDHPEWDVAVWFDCLSFVGSEKADDFNADMEQWFHSHFDPSDAMVRPEWSKGWGYTTTGAWTSEPYISQTIPDSHTDGQRRNERWNTAIKRLDKLDPARVFSNDFIDRLMQRR
ncbi:MAG TPA: FAD-linked oxidase [Spongiibacteraceae bacterium]|nr:FAD-linked oxidase [Spongiibacteraceae bacterium]HCS26017.1 FAD-linked oxidase [Spongiibacteraceae bacterium]